MTLAIPHIFSATEHSLTQWLSTHKQPAYRASQILTWLYVRHQTNPTTWSDIPQSLREFLAKEWDWTLPAVTSLLESEDGSTKVLLKWHDNKVCECVVMPSPKRITICISSQVGCKMGCVFCQTGRMGLSRNLSFGEIVWQLSFANQLLEEKAKQSQTLARRVTNVVFMGMGEPLDNYDNVVAACRLMIDPRQFGLSKHKVTVSTVGLVPEIERLGADVPVALAVSLHGATDELRQKLVPIGKVYPISVLRKALLRYPQNTRHGVTFEYILIDGVNDTLNAAKELVRFLNGFKAKVNLIPMNAHPSFPMQTSTPQAVAQFSAYLREKGIVAPVRYSRGQDISAACGQLAAKKQNELHLAPRTVARLRKQEEKA